MEKEAEVQPYEEWVLENFWTVMGSALAGFLRGLVSMAGPAAYEQYVESLGLGLSDAEIMGYTEEETE